MIGVPDVLGPDVPRETIDKLQLLEQLITLENRRQNLIAPSTVSDFWQRHLLDSAQLLRFSAQTGSWLDIGSGAGLPGLVIAVLRSDPITLVEPRKLRAEFLLRAAGELRLSNVTVEGRRAEACRGAFDFISARAVAKLSDLFAMAHHLAHRDTRWILPKGRSAAIELAEAQRSWQGQFRVEPSITAPDAAIIVGSEVSARHKGRG